MSNTCLVRFDKNRYSVDARAVARPVEIRACADRQECWQDGKIVGRHERVFGRGKTIYDPLHYVPVLMRKPGALRNGAPFKDWDLPPDLRRVQRKLERQPGGDRQVVETLGAVLTAPMFWELESEFKANGNPVSQQALAVRAPGRHRREKSGGSFFNADQGSAFNAD